MEIKFYKYQGTGNDFVILDNRDGLYKDLSRHDVFKLCHRHFGIGGDGLMMLNEKKGYDFEMVYYNSDGKLGSMCGNGGRCMVRFAYDLGIHKTTYKFIAADGPHDAEIDVDGIISLKMQDVNGVKKNHQNYILNTGSPHYVRFVTDLMNIDVVTKGREIRNSPEFVEEGINVNFVERLELEDHILVRTYERGVENETFSCGTGVTAAAIVCYHNENGFNQVDVKTLGGNLSVEYDRINDNVYQNIWLTGPAEKVFDGMIDIN